MSQVHEKLNSLPNTDEKSVKPALSLASHPNSAPSLAKTKPKIFDLLKKNKKFVVLGSVAIICLIGGLAIRAWMIALEAEFAAKPIQRDPVSELTELFKQERFQDSFPLIEEISKEDPENSSVKIYLSYAKKKTQDVESARKILEDVLTLKPNEPAALNNLGQIHAQKRQWPVAIEFYEKALIAKPDYAEAHFNAAAAYENLGNWAQAVQHYEKFLSFDTEHSSLHQSIRQRTRRLRSFQTYAATLGAKS